MAGRFEAYPPATTTPPTEAMRRARWIHVEAGTTLVVALPPREDIDRMLTAAAEAWDEFGLAELEAQYESAGVALREAQRAGRSARGGRNLRRPMSLRRRGAGDGGAGRGRASPGLRRRCRLGVDAAGSWLLHILLSRCPPPHRRQPGLRRQRRPFHRRMPRVLYAVAPRCVCDMRGWVPVLVPASLRRSSRAHPSRAGSTGCSGRTCSRRPSGTGREARLHLPVVRGPVTARLVHVLLRTKPWKRSLPARPALWALRDLTANVVARPVLVTDHKVEELRADLPQEG